VAGSRQHLAAEAEAEKLEELRGNIVVSPSISNIKNIIPKAKNRISNDSKDSKDVEIHHQFLEAIGSVLPCSVPPSVPPPFPPPSSSSRRYESIREAWWSYSKAVDSDIPRTREAAGEVWSAQ
jgi:hypothetical protein